MSGVELVLLVSALAVVQSIFGVGVLIFGTPVLLFAGFGFQEVLTLLLPASVTISLLQIACDRGLSLANCRSLILPLVPTVIVGLALALHLALPKIDVIVSVVLVATAFLRVSDRGRVILVRLARRHKKLMLSLIGMLHGLTNLGGSLLEAYVSSLHNRKISIRQNIALGYALFAVVQLLTLAIAGGLIVDSVNMAIATAAGGVYLTVGRYCFAVVSQQQYSKLISALMVFAAAALVAKRVIA